MGQCMEPYTQHWASIISPIMFQKLVHKYLYICVHICYYYKHSDGFGAFTYYTNYYRDTWSQPQPCSVCTWMQVGERVSKQLGAYLVVCSPNTCISWDHHP